MAVDRHDLADFSSIRCVGSCCEFDVFPGCRFGDPVGGLVIRLSIWQSACRFGNPRVGLAIRLAIWQSACSAPNFPVIERSGNDLEAGEKCQRVANLRLFGTGCTREARTAPFCPGQ
jgi:hypothetical protein